MTKQRLSSLQPAQQLPLQLWRLFTLPALSLLLLSCATWQQPGDSGDNALLRHRAVTARVADVSINAAVLSTADSLRMLGADVIKTGVQPVWIEVENSSSQTLWLLRSGTDPDYFSPLEVAWSFHSLLSPGINKRIDAHFDALSFRNPILPGARQAGILFTNPHHQTRLLNIDLLGHGKVIPFSLFPPVPDDTIDETGANILKLFADTQAINYRGNRGFRAALEKTPCCAMGSDATTAGDPLNMVLVGEFEDIASALVRRNFRKIKLDSDDAQRLFGRPADVAVRKEGQGGIPAYWMRMWVAPLRYQGQPVFMVQAGRPVGGRFAHSKESDTVLHANVDEVRNNLIQDLLYSGGLAKLGFVSGVGKATSAQPRSTLGGDKYHTDGMRAVLFFETRPLALSEVQILDWEPVLKRREARAMKEIR